VIVVPAWPASRRSADEGGQAAEAAWRIRLGRQGTGPCGADAGKDRRRPRSRAIWMRCSPLLRKGIAGDSFFGDQARGPRGCRRACVRRWPGLILSGRFTCPCTLNRWSAGGLALIAPSAAGRHGFIEGGGRENPRADSDGWNIQSGRLGCLQAYQCVNWRCGWAEGSAGERVPGDGHGTVQGFTREKDASLVESLIR